MNWNDENINEVQFISFNVAEEEYGVSVLEVEEIIRLPYITKLPKTPDFIKGVINLRGSVIPVVDMRERFDLEKKEYSFLTRAIIVNVQDKSIGMIVDRVNKVYRLANDNIDLSSDLSSQISSEFIKGIGKLDERIIIFIDIDKLFSDREIQHLETANRSTEQQVEAATA